MTDIERAILQALNEHAAFPAVGRDKLFVRDLVVWDHRNPDGVLTKGQRGYLYGLRWRYRAQIPDEVPGLEEGRQSYDDYRRGQRGQAVLAEKRKAANAPPPDPPAQGELL